MKKVLIVDDESDILELIEDFFKVYYGTSVLITTASDGLDAFLLCKVKLFDLIITDLRMPFMSGIELISAIKTKANNNKNTGIVLLSAFIDKDVQAKLKAQKIEFLDKPLNNSDLLAVTDKYMMAK